MANEFSVTPAGDFSQGLTGIGAILTQATQQKKERDLEEKARAEKAQAQVDLLEAWHSGDPNQMAEVAMKHPTISQQAALGLGLQKDYQKKEATDFAIEALSNPEKAGDIAAKRIDLLTMQKRNPTDTARFLEQYQKDPQTALKGLEMNFAAINPEAHKSFKEITQPKLTEHDPTKALVGPNGKEVVAAVPKDETPDAIKTLETRAQAAGLVKGTPEYQEFMKYGGVPSAAIQQLQETKANADKPVTDKDQMALDIQTTNYINSGGKTLPYSRTTNPEAMRRNQAVMDNAASWAQSAGLSSDELMAKGSEFKSDTASLGKQTQRMDQLNAVFNSFHNNLDTWNSLAEGIVPQLGGKYTKDVAGALRKFDYSGIRSLDEFRMKVDQQFNDPTASAIAIAATEAAMDYAKIMQGGQTIAAPTKAVMDKAVELLNASADEKGRKGIMAALDSSATGQIKGIEDQLKATKDRLGVSKRIQNADTSSKPDAGQKRLKFNPSTGKLE